MNSLKILLSVFCLMMGWNASANLPTIAISPEESAAIVQFLSDTNDDSPVAKSSLKRIVQVAEVYYSDYSRSASGLRTEFVQDLTHEMKRLIDILNTEPLTYELRLQNVGAVLLIGALGRLLEGRLPAGMIQDGTLDRFLKVVEKVYGVILH